MTTIHEEGYPPVLPEKIKRTPIRERTHQINGQRLRLLTSPNRLKKAMNAKGWTYRELAYVADCAPSRISTLRNGRYPRVRPDLAERIEDALDQPRGSLFAPIRLQHIHPKPRQEQPQ